MKKKLHLLKPKLKKIFIKNLFIKQLKIQIWINKNYIKKCIRNVIQ